MMRRAIQVLGFTLAFTEMARAHSTFNNTQEYKVLSTDRQ